MRDAAAADDDDAFLWPPRTLHNGWANTDDPEALSRFATEQTIRFNAGGGGFGEPGSLFKLSWTLTAQTATVLESVLPGRPKSLRELDAAGARPSLAPFAERVADAGCLASNILSVDFAVASDAVRAARLMSEDASRRAWEEEGTVRVGVQRPRTSRRRPATRRGRGRERGTYVETKIGKTDSSSKTRERSVRVRVEYV